MLSSSYQKVRQLIIEIGTWLQNHECGVSVAMFIFGFALMVAGALTVAYLRQHTEASTVRAEGLMFGLAGVLMGLAIGTWLRPAQREIAWALVGTAFVTYIIPGFYIPKEIVALYYAIGFPLLGAAASQLWSRAQCSPRSAGPSEAKRANRRSVMTGIALLVICGVASFVLPAKKDRSLQPRTGYSAWAILVALVIAAVAFGVLLWILDRDFGKAVLLGGGAMVGAVAGQAKDVALRRYHSGRIWQDMRNALRAAYTNESSAAFIFRVAEWSGFAIAAAVFSNIIGTS